MELGRLAFALLLAIAGASRATREQLAALSRSCFFQP